MGHRRIRSRPSRAAGQFPAEMATGSQPATSSGGHSGLLDRAGPALRLGQAPTAGRAGAPVQAKREVGAVDDPLEREADSTAERVMRSADGASASGNLVRSPVSGPPNSGGQPLDQATRAFVEPRFGQDFGHVRIHTDAAAASSAEAIHAKAYTAGSDIVFGPGQYAPHSDGGRRLLAHELTHVAQQGGGKTSAVQRDVIDMPPVTIRSTRNPVERAVPGLGNLAGQGVTSGGPTLAHGQQSVTQNAPTPTDLLPFRGGGWDGDAILTKLGQYDTVAGTDSDAIRCVQAVAMASRIPRGPAAVTHYLRAMILEGMMSRPQGQRLETLAQDGSNFTRYFADQPAFGIFQYIQILGKLTPSAFSAFAGTP